MLGARGQGIPWNCICSRLIISAVTVSLQVRCGQLRRVALVISIRLAVDTHILGRVRVWKACLRQTADPVNRRQRSKRTRIYWTCRISDDLACPVQLSTPWIRVHHIFGNRPWLRVHFSWSMTHHRPCAAVKLYTTRETTQNGAPGAVG